MTSNNCLLHGCRRILATACVASVLWWASVSAQTLPGPLRTSIDSAVAEILVRSGAPSASIAVVWNGGIAYEKAYGIARIAAEAGGESAPATPAMRYSVGSVSKQFTAAAVLLLAEEGKLSLGDKVARWLPELTRANEITIRHLLSMTSGYQDYWPQDYVLPVMMSPTTPRDVLAQWARKPLDFAPGTRWQYSNTNYVVAGLIVEAASGLPLSEFLRQRVFTPLRMTSVRDVDRGPLDNTDAAAYLRHALGPLRPAPKEANGWLFAAGDLAMTAHDLALWDISMLDRTILKQDSYKAMLTEAKPSTGGGNGYGLGVFVRNTEGRRQIAHGGAVSGYLTANAIYPDDRAAIVAFVNIYPGATGPEQAITDAIQRVLFKPTEVGIKPGVALVRDVFLALQKGQINRDLFTSNGNAYFSAQVVSDFASSLGPLGPPVEFRQTSEGPRGGMTFRIYRARCGVTDIQISVATLPDGRIEQYMVAKAG
jgi:D-alanyl-D-alanine carboxypeptidase